MKDLISLDGKWHASGITPEGNRIELLADVPGMIHVDLERDGLIPPMFWRDNAEQCQWVEHCYWTYEREFDIPQDADLTFAVIEFGGLDTYADITINGIPVGKTRNMMVPYRFDVSSILHHGKNTIRVAFTPYQDMIVGKPLHYPAAFNKAERVHVRRMQCTFYWDWVNRFITFGLWRSVKIYFYDHSYIDSLFAYTHDIAPTSASINIQLDTAYRDDDYVALADVEIVDPDGYVVWEEKHFHIIDRHMRLQADIRDPRLWWPIGYGDHPLYTIRARLYSPEGELLDSHEETFGIRTVRLEQLKDVPGTEDYQKSLALRKQNENDREGDIPGSSFILLINGVRIFCKGGNWVPANPFPCTITREKYERLIRYAAEGGLNLLRCWGGGIYEPADFFNACDRMGVMVSQDFTLACAAFPEEDEEFMDNMKYEIPLAVKMLRDHASLVWWAGDNENACHFDWDARKAPGVRLCREVYYPVLDRLDPSRPFRPTSPAGGLNNCSATIGDCHMSHWREGGDYRENLKRLGRFASESVFFGSPMMTSLHKFMTDEDIADPDKAMFEYHVKDNPHKPEGAPTLYEGMRLQSNEVMGEPTSPADKIRRDSYLQYEWARLSMEGARRNKWYTAGLQYWMYNDCWPAVGLSTIDYYLIPKAAYYALKRASKPVIASINNAKDGYEIWTLNDSRKTVSGHMTIYVQRFSGERRVLREINFHSDANENNLITTIGIKEAALRANEVLICDMEAGEMTDRAVFFREIPAKLVFPKTKISFKINKKEQTITVKSKGYARVVTFDGDMVMEDNFFDLLPGEEKTVRYECLNGFDPEQAEMYCWNM